MKRNFSSEVGVEDGVKSVQETTFEDENEDELISQPGLSGENDDDDNVEPSQNEMELLETKTNPSEKKWATSALLKAIMDSPGISVHDTLDKWVAEGNELSQGEVFLVMISFRRSRMYERALQVS